MLIDLTKINNLSSTLSNHILIHKELVYNSINLRQNFLSQKEVFSKGFNEVINDLTSVIEMITKNNENKAKDKEDEEELSPASNLYLIIKL